MKLTVEEYNKLGYFDVGQDLKIYKKDNELLLLKIEDDGMLSLYRRIVLDEKEKTHNQ